MIVKSVVCNNISNMRSGDVCVHCVGVNQMDELDEPMFEFLSS